VLDLAVERSVARRLADLGLTIGSTARVMQTSSTTVILAARGSRLALGRPLAETIRVAIEPGETGA
jgi:Fe2+ transport system protein FeoA